MAASEQIQNKVIRTYKDLLEVLENTHFYIYGNGYVAKRFYWSLQKYNLQENVIGFITTKKSTDTFMGLHINSIDDIDINGNHLICIAVHESICQEIIEILESREFNKCIWIYPYLYEFLLGAPILVDEDIPVKKVIDASHGDWLALWHIAIDQYYGKNDYGYCLYVRAWNLLGDLHTAEQRLRKFQELIEKWDLHGYDEASSISVLDNYRVIDGSHRVSLAVYHGLDILKGRIYAKPDSMDFIHDKNILLPREFLLKQHFEPNIINIIDSTRNKIELKLGS